MSPMQACEQSAGNQPKMADNCHKTTRIHREGITLQAAYEAERAAARALTEEAEAERIRRHGK